MIRFRPEPDSTPECSTNANADQDTPGNQARNIDRRNERQREIPCCFVFELGVELRCDPKIGQTDAANSRDKIDWQQSATNCLLLC